VRVITWNVAGRVSRQPEQAQAIAAVGADVVALQEVTSRTLPLWRVALAESGFTACETALDGLPEMRRGRLLGVLTASRHPLVRLPAPADVPWPDRVLCCVADDVEVVNLHSPIAPAPDLAKVRTHEAIAAYLATGSDRPRILCGDLNTPRRELPDGDVLTFAHDSAGRLRPERGERWDRAERALVHGLRTHGGSMPSAPCTATASARQAGPSHAIAGGGGWTTSWSTGCGRWPAPMRTTGGARASATTRPSSPTSFAERLDAESRRVRRAPSGHTHLRGPTQREDAIHG
jgi:exodeoxyribonuclease-3